jgi:hypothetical protein
MAALSMAALGLLVSVFVMLSNGTFLADYYYLPLREFVPEENHRAMEERVIVLYDTQARWMGRIGVGVCALQIWLLLQVRRWVLRDLRKKGEQSLAAESR